MAKAEVTEEALAQGIQSLGGFGTLAAKPRRDSPFGSAFAPKRTEPAPQPVPQATPTPAPVVPAPSAPDITRVTQPISKQVDVIAATPDPVRAPAPKVQPLKTLSPKAAVAHAAGELDEPLTKADEFTERITLQMTPEMRDKLGEIARVLQRSKREKGERITPNTLMRVAIKSFIDGFDSQALRGVSSEEELLREVQGMRRRRG